MQSDLRRQFSKLSSVRVLVVGDIMLDRYTWGNAERASPEAPVMVLQADSQEDRLGGAAGVARLAGALCARVEIVGIIGDDFAGQTICRLIEQSQIDGTGLLCDPNRPTTVKHRFIGRAGNRHPQQVLRVDEESRCPISTELQDKLAQIVFSRLDLVDSILISDYAKGLCAPQLLHKILVAAAARDIPVVVDPARYSDYEKYRGAAVITPNRVECELATGFEITSAGAALTAAEKLISKYDFKAAMVTLDKEGIALTTAAGGQQVIPTSPRDVYDVTGAGDMVLAVVGLCQAAGIDFADAAQIANIAAALEVERQGVAPVSRLEIMNSISRQTVSDAVVDLPLLEEIVSMHRANGDVVVFTNGCFDLLHIGHVRYLQEAAAMGDLLVVAVNSDESVRSLKGNGRPINSQQDRSEILAALSCVDYVVVFEETTPYELISRIRPAILVKGGDYADQEIVGRDIVEGDGGTVRVLGYTKDISTSGIVDALRNDGRPR